MIQQYLRTYSPVEKKKALPTPVQRLSKKQRAMKAILKPFEGKTLVFDTETTTDAQQLLRFGFFMIHGLSGEEIHSRYDRGVLKREDADMLREAGFFYNPDVLTEEEIALLKTSCERVTLAHIADRLGVECSPHEEKHLKLHCLPVAQFVRYFYALQKRDAYMVMGHNLPFDLSRLAVTWTKARKTMTGGFSLKLCECQYKQKGHCPNHPNLLIKHLGFAKAFMRRTKSSKANKTKFSDVHFLDTQTLSNSLLADASSLDSLGKMLLADVSYPNGKRRPSKLRKRARPDGIRQGTTLTLRDIMYGVQDVLCTYTCYRKLRTFYLMHDIETPIWNLYSSASMGKAHLKMFGVKPFLEAHPDFPPEIIGYSMHAYYGARNEVGVRLQPVEIMYLDCLSQYTTASALMKLQDVFLAEHITIEENTQEVQDWLNQPVDVLLAQLAHPEFWPKLRGFVQIKPDMDRLPFRGKYGSEGTNVAIPYVKSDTSLWYTLADVIASKLLTDKTPIIARALSLVPSKEQYPTRKRQFFDYEVDLTKHDLFTELINIRNDIKKRLKEETLSEQQRSLLESQQKALKLIASATSYGAMVEINQDEETQETHPVLYYDIHGQALQTKVPRVERPGKYFAGPIGTLIPAAGRLMLAIAERLGRERGLSYAMMDTDAIAFVRPDDMASDTFRKRVLEIQSYFDTLSPYEGKPSILELEKENFDNTEIVPLFFLGVSSKRYVLWQEDNNGNIRIVKFSSHGLGGMYAPYADNDSPFLDIPEPCKDVQDLGGARWVYDLWYRVIYGFKQNVNVDGVTLLKRNPKTGEPVFHIASLSQLQIPRFHKLTISTWNLYMTYAKRKGREGIEDLRPFNFISLLPSHIGNPVYSATRLVTEVDDVEEHNKRYAFVQALNRPFYAPFASNPDELHAIRCLDTPSTNELVPDWFRLYTVGESVRSHFVNKEHKARNGDEVGYLQPRTMRVESENDIIYVGKEINEIQASMGDETDYLLGDFIPLEYGSSKKLVDWKERLEPYHIADLIVATGLAKSVIYDIKSGKRVPSTDTKKSLEDGFNLLTQHEGCFTWRERAVGEIASLLEMDNEQVIHLLYGKLKITAMQRRMLLHSMGIHESEEEKRLALEEERKQKIRRLLPGEAKKKVVLECLENKPRATIGDVIAYIEQRYKQEGVSLFVADIQPTYEEVKEERRTLKKKRNTTVNVPHEPEKANDLPTC